MVVNTLAAQRLWLMLRAKKDWAAWQSKRKYCTHVQKVVDLENPRGGRRDDRWNADEAAHENEPRLSLCRMSRYDGPG